MATPASSATSRIPVAAQPLVENSRVAAAISEARVSCARRARMGNSYRLDGFDVVPFGGMATV